MGGTFPVIWFTVKAGPADLIFTVNAGPAEKKKEKREKTSSLLIGEIQDVIYIYIIIVSVTSELFTYMESILSYNEC